MLIQAIIYGVLILLTLLAVAESIRTCFRDEEVKKTTRVWTAPVEALKNKLKDMKTLKEDKASPAQPPITVQTV